MAQSLNNLPFQQVKFVNEDGTITYDGYQLLLSLLQKAAESVPTATVGVNIVATGLTQATATPLESQWNVVGTVPANSGVLLETMNDGQTETVINAGANNLNVYPPPGYAIGSSAANASYVLTPGKMQIFQFTASPQILTTQLQIP